MTPFWTLILIANLFTIAGVVSRQVWLCVVAVVFSLVAIVQLVTVGAA